MEEEWWWGGGARADVCTYTRKNGSILIGNSMHLLRISTLVRVSNYV